VTQDNYATSDVSYWYHNLHRELCALRLYSSSRIY